jgi:hypothetical protein
VTAVRFWASAASIALLLVVVQATIIRERVPSPTDPHLAIGGDALHYLAMTDGSLSSVPAPFRYRLLVPAVAAATGLPAIQGLTVVSYVSMFGFYLVSLATCRRLGLDLNRSLQGLLFVCTAAGSLYIYTNPLITDATVLLFIASATYAVVRRNITLFCVTCLLGSLAHERMLFFLPLWFATGERLKGLSIMVVGVGLYAALRVAVGPGEVASIETTWRGMALLARPIEIVAAAILSSATVYSMAALGVLASMRRELNRLVGVSLGAALVPAAFAADTGRMLSAFGPIAIVLCAILFSVVQRRQLVTLLLVLSVSSVPMAVHTTVVPIDLWHNTHRAATAAFLVAFALCLAALIRSEHKVLGIGMNRSGLELDRRAG